MYFPIGNITSHGLCSLPIQTSTFLIKLIIFYLYMKNLNMQKTQNLRRKVVGDIM